MVRAEEVVSDHQSSVEGRIRLRYLANLTTKRHCAWYRETHMLNMWISAPRRCPPRSHQRHKAIPIQYVFHCRSPAKKYFAFALPVLPLIHLLACWSSSGRYRA